jgi:hypothetical protein
MGRVHERIWNVSRRAPRLHVPRTVRGIRSISPRRRRRWRPLRGDDVRTNHLISRRGKSSAWSHAFEHVRKDRWQVLWTSIR